MTRHALHAALLAAVTATGTGHGSENQGATIAGGQDAVGGRMSIVRMDSVPPVEGPDAWFTGDAVITPVFSATEQTPTGCASVEFAPGARSAWHTHPAGQLLVVTEGNGWIQEWGHARREIAAGDVIRTPPGVKHWHGATATEPMTHLAMQQAVDGDVVDWMEKVSDEQYYSARER